MPGFLRSSSFVLHLTAAAAAAPAPAVSFVCFDCSGASDVLRGLGFSGGVVRPVFGKTDEVPEDDNDDFEWVDRLEVPKPPFSFWEASVFGFGDLGIDATGRSETSAGFVFCTTEATLLELTVSRTAEGAAETLPKMPLADSAALGFTAEALGFGDPLAASRWACRTRSSSCSIP